MTDFNKFVLLASVVLLVIGCYFFIALSFSPDLFVFGDVDIIILVSFAVSGFLFLMWVFLQVTNEKPKQNPITASVFF